MNDKVLVGTFHKTGTALMRKIMSQIAAALDLRFWPMANKDLPEPEEWDIAFHSHSEFPEQLMRKHPHRGVLIIRDPRDVVVSAAHYHCKSTERWLHEPHKRFNGMTYQEKINSLKNMRHRFEFEMRNAGGRTIHRMLEARKKYPDFLIFRFEDLTTDRDLIHFRAMFRHLGLPAERMDDMLRIVEKHSLFSGKVKPSTHVRSGQPGQWKHEFTPKVLEAFMQRFPTAPEELGYDPSSPDRLVRPRVDRLQGVQHF